MIPRRGGFFWSGDIPGVPKQPGIREEALIEA